MILLSSWEKPSRLTPSSWQQKEKQTAAATWLAERLSLERGHGHHFKQLDRVQILTRSLFSLHLPSLPQGKACLLTRKRKLSPPTSKSDPFSSTDRLL
mmetsp:Transcript_16777/g.37947  ORF Transcript_16777/g.37947 Transcript_16777/m.37947 type:complete len:98 (-) Transcript_16777:377-670(-)